MIFGRHSPPRFVPQTRQQAIPISFVRKRGPLCLWQCMVSRSRLVRLGNPTVLLRPDGVSFLDKDGHGRTRMRLKWWLCGSGRLSFRKAGLGLEETEQDLLPDDDLPAETHHRFAPDGKPTFFGHYWFSNMPPAPSSPTTACVDYSVAQGGTLVAYRWDGENELHRDKFCFV